MYKIDKLNGLSLQGLVSQTRTHSDYLRHMRLLAESLESALAPCSFEVDCSGLAHFGKPLLILDVPGIDHPIPFDGMLADVLQPRPRKRLLDALREPARFLDAASRNLLRRQRDTLALSYMLNLKRYDVVREEYHAIEQLEAITGASWVFTSQVNVHQYLEVLWEGCRVHFELGVAAAALTSSDHPLHRDAMLWCRLGEYKGRQEFLLSVIRRARDKISRLWQVASHRHLDAGLGHLPSIENAPGGLSWPAPLFPDTPRQEPPGYGLILGTYHDYWARWDARGFQEQLRNLGPGDAGIPKLTRIYYKVETLLEDACMPDGPLLLCLERDRASGRISDYGDDVLGERRRANWVSLCWIYLQSFEGLYHCWKTYGSHRIPGFAVLDALKPADEHFLIDRDPAERVNAWLAGSGVNAATENLEDFTATTDVDTQKGLETMLALLVDFDRALGEILPAKLPRFAPSVHDEHAACRLDHALNAYYQTLRKGHELRRRTEAILSSAYTRLAGYVTVSESGETRCFDALARQTLYRLNHGDYAPIAGGSLRRLAESNPSDTPETGLQRNLVAWQLLSCLPSTADLFEATAFLDQRDQGTVTRRYAFLKKAHGERLHLDARLRQRLSKALGAPNQRTLRYAFFGLDPKRCRRWHERFDKLARQAGFAADCQSLIHAADDFIALGCALERDTDPITLKEGRSRFPEGLLPADTWKWLAEELAEDREEAGMILIDIETVLARLFDIYRCLAPESAHLFPRDWPGLGKLTVLRREQQLIDAATPGNLARLAVLEGYNHQAWSDLFEKLADGNPIVPDRVRQVFSRRFQELWRKEQRVAPALRAFVLQHVPELLELEQAHLHRLLCLLQPRPPRLVPALADLMAMFEASKRGGEALCRELGEVWLILHTWLQKQDPGPYRANYRENLRLLETAITQLPLIAAEPSQSPAT